MGDEARLLRGQPVHDDRPRPAVGVAAELEAVGQLRDHADVRLPPPLAVGDDVQPRHLLQRDGRGDGRPMSRRYSSGGTGAASLMRSLT